MKTVEDIKKVENINQFKSLQEGDCFKSCYAWIFEQGYFSLNYIIEEIKGNSRIISAEGEGANYLTEIKDVNKIKIEEKRVWIPLDSNENFEVIEDIK